MGIGRQEPGTPNRAAARVDLEQTTASEVGLRDASGFREPRGGDPQGVADQAHAERAEQTPTAFGDQVVSAAAIVDGIDARMAHAAEQPAIVGGVAHDRLGDEIGRQAGSREREIDHTTRGGVLGKSLHQRLETRVGLERRERRRRGDVECQAGIRELREAVEGRVMLRIHGLRQRAQPDHHRHVGRQCVGRIGFA